MLSTLGFKEHPSGGSVVKGFTSREDWLLNTRRRARVCVCVCGPGSEVCRRGHRPPHQAHVQHRADAGHTDPHLPTVSGPLSGAQRLTLGFCTLKFSRRFSDTHTHTHTHTYTSTNVRTHIYTHTHTHTHSGQMQ